jgi:hypothetical protein
MHGCLFTLSELCLTSVRVIKDATALHPHRAPGPRSASARPTTAKSQTPSATVTITTTDTTAPEQDPSFSMSFVTDVIGLLVYSLLSKIASPMRCPVMQVPEPHRPPFRHIRILMSTMMSTMQPRYVPIRHDEVIPVSSQLIEPSRHTPRSSCRCHQSN